MLFNLAAMFTSYAMGVSQAGLDDFEPVAQTGSAYLMVLVAKNSPYKNFGDLIEAAKEKPDTIKNSTNIGAILHVVSLALGDATGVGFRDVQGGGATKRFSSVLGGHSDFTMGLTAESKAYLDSGDFKALAILSNERHKSFPDVPTVKELGYDFVGMDVSRWWFMPKGTAKDRVNYMADAIGKAMKDPEVVHFYESRGASPTFLRDKALQEKLYQDRDFIEKLVKKYNLMKK